MKVKQEHKKLFHELEQWSRRKDVFSIDDFLKEKNIHISDFEAMANRGKKFMKIWGKAESQAWENVLHALFTKSLPRARIAEYIKESDVFQGQDPEEIMQSLEAGQARFELYLTAIGDTDALQKYGHLNKMGDIEALMKCSLEQGLINQKTYEEIMANPDEENEDDDRG